jgi:glutathione S-transferase
MQKPIFHIDPLQPESRALLTFCRTTKIDYDTVSYNFLESTQKKSDVLLTLNPSGELPFMQAEKNIQGAHTILRYLCNTRLPSSNKLYPSDPVAR